MTDHAVYLTYPPIEDMSIAFVMGWMDWQAARAMTDAPFAAGTLEHAHWREGWLLAASDPTDRGFVCVH